MKFAILAAAALLAVVTQPACAQDAAAGEKVFAQCRACHQVGETAKNLVAAALADVKAGRKVATPFAPPYGCSVKYKDA